MDPQAFRIAAAAQKYADALREQSRGAMGPSEYRRRSREAAEAYDVAGDAWEAAGHESRIAREWADRLHLEAFKATRPVLSPGFYYVTDREARALVAGVTRNAKLRMPDGRYYVLVRLGPPGRGNLLELHRLNLTLQEREAMKRKRPWVYGVVPIVGSVV